MGLPLWLTNCPSSYFCCFSFAWYVPLSERLRGQPLWLISLAAIYCTRAAHYLKKWRTCKLIFDMMSSMMERWWKSSSMLFLHISGEDSSRQGCCPCCFRCCPAGCACRSRPRGDERSALAALVWSQMKKAWAAGCPRDCFKAPLPGNERAWVDCKEKLK